MSRTVSNVRRARLLRAGLPAVPAAAATLALVGVAARPAVGLAEARRLQGDVEERLHRLRDAPRRLEAFEQAGGFERLVVALDAAEAVFPDRPSELEVHGAVRLAAELVGLRLETVRVGEPVDAGLGDEGRVRIARRSVDVAGEGPPERLAALERALDELGMPCAVLGLSAERAGPAGDAFAVSATLGVFHRIPIAAPADGEEDS